MEIEIFLIVVCGNDCFYMASNMGTIKTLKSSALYSRGRNDG